MSDLWALNHRDFFGVHRFGQDPDTECLACERFNEATLRASGLFTEEQLTVRRDRRRQAGEVVSDQDAENPPQPEG